MPLFQKYSPEATYRAAVAASGFSTKRDTAKAPSTPLSDEPQRGDAGRRGGVAAHGLEHHRTGDGADLAQLLGDDETVLLIGDDQRRRKPNIAGDPEHGLLQQAA